MIHKLSNRNEVNPLVQLKARVIKPFTAKGNEFNIGDIFYIRDHGILLYGEWFCDDDSPFASEHFELVKE